MEKIQLMIISVLIVISALADLDFITYILKPSPKQSFFSMRFWFFGFISTMAVLYWILNRFKFL